MDIMSATRQTAQASGTGRTTDANGSRAPGQGIASDYQTFLLMLTTQMQNQDPLNPIDSSDYAAQLATFSGVEQQVKTNALLESLASQLAVAGLAQMTAWVGMEARVTTPVMFDGSPLTLYPAPSPGSDQTVLVILDAGGREVSRMPVPVSDTPLVWAGTDSTGAPLPQGPYAFRLESYMADKLAETTPVEAYGRIDEVRAGADGAVIVLEGGANVAPADIRAVRNPPAG
ncbi:MAG: flagellar hook capping FlgD N-terminal domain-containing protein [Albidovulum sp.]